MPELNPAREAWRRLPWRRWIARGALFGLSAATALALILFHSLLPLLIPRHPMLESWSWLWFFLGGLNLVALTTALAGWRAAPVALCGAAVLGFAYEAVVFGSGAHLLRIPLALAIALWAAQPLCRPTVRLRR